MASPLPVVPPVPPTPSIPSDSTDTYTAISPTQSGDEDVPVSIPEYYDPPGNLSLSQNPVQCEDVTLFWSGGLSPVRIEFYQQETDTSDWESIPRSFTNVVYSNDTVQNHTWNVNVGAGRQLWVQLVDHTGSFTQNQVPWTVDASDNTDCLPVERTARQDLFHFNRVSNVFLVLFLIFFITTLVFGALWDRSKRKLDRYQKLPRSRAVIDSSNSRSNSRRSTLITEARTSPYIVNGLDLERSSSSDAASSEMKEARHGLGFLQMSHQGNRRTQTEYILETPTTSDSAHLTFNSQQPLLEHPQKTFTESPVEDPFASTADLASLRSQRTYSISSQTSDRSMMTPSINSSVVGTIRTTATKNSTDHSTVDTESNDGSDRLSLKSTRQFFPIRITSNSASTPSSSSRSPFRDALFSRQ